MSQNEKRRVFVARSGDDGPSETEILKLLSQAEIDLATVRFENGELLDGGMSPDDALVVPLVDNMTDEPAIQKVVLAAARAGVCNIVGVWAQGQEGTAIHSAIVKYGTAQIPWDPSKLMNELGSDCENAFEASDGSDADPTEVEPNECE